MLDEAWYVAGSVATHIEHVMAIVAAVVHVVPHPTISGRPPDTPRNSGLPSQFTTSILSISGLVIAAASAIFTYCVSRATIWQRANHDEIEAVQSKLETFYGPLVQMLQTDHLLAQDLRSRQGTEDYRLLLKLFDANWRDSLDEGARSIVREICHNGARIEAFIRQHVGMVNYQLVPYFARASAHFRILYLAHLQRLGDDPRPFARYVYPVQLDGVLQLEIERLIRRQEQLRNHPNSAPAPVELLVIPDELALDEWPNPGGTRVMQ